MRMLLYDNISRSEAETYSLGKIFGERLMGIFNLTFKGNANDTAKPSYREIESYKSNASACDNLIFVALYGDLGSGKTVFVRGMTSELSPSSHVQSPSYTIVNEYCSGSVKVCHFDMYRISSDDDLISIGFYDYSRAVMVVEWSEKIPYALPKAYWSVKFIKTEDEERHITVEYVCD